MRDDDDLPAGLPLLNEPAPDFEARTTQGSRRLEDYAGRWLVLFSHPADFTPVCTSEFVAFARHWQQFQELECDLLGLSVDSAYSHIAWLRAIRERFGVEIPFPIVEDVAMRVARRYGMVHPGASDTSTVRATFVIDPDGMLRAMLYYPLSTGRSIPEILRLVRALRTAAEHRMATPESWQPGDPVVEPPPETFAASDASPPIGGECVDWYFRTRSL
ncbi:MAG: peroxiredoxin [Planctomycetes bacterium]|nr:peroxiredoxin [Planctomycetota bacterium]